MHMWPSEILKVCSRECAFHYTLDGSTTIGLFGENGHKISLIVCKSLLLNESTIHLLWNTSYTTSLSGYILD